jgi:hypothetical protein
VGTNACASRLHVDLNTRVREFLEEVQQQAIGMMPFEHAGLQRIKELVPDLVPTLDLHHIFVVQLSSGADESDALPGLVAVPLAAETFHSSALTVECIIAKDPSQVTVEARFDQAVIPVPDMERMLESFAHIAAQLAQPEQNPNAHLRIKDI